MDNDQRRDFYKDQYFEGLNTRLAAIENGQRDIQRDVADIKSKVIYMYGFAAAVGIGASFILDWIKGQFMVPH